MRSSTSVVLAIAGMAFAAPAADGAYRDVVLSDNPTSYFRMDDANTTMNNETAQPDGTHVTSTNGPFLEIAGALNVESPNKAVGYLDTEPDRSTFTVGAYDAFSIEFFVFTAEASPPPAAIDWFAGKGLVDGDVAGASNDTGVTMIRGGHVAFGLGNPDTTIESTSPINDGTEWHHVVATSDGAGSMKLYIDGVLEAQASGAPSAGRTNTTFNVGATLTPIIGNGQLVGAIDEVAFYTSALTQADVSQHFSGGFPAHVPVTFSVKGGGTVDGPFIACREGTGSCTTNEPLGAVRDYTAIPDPGHRLGNFSFLGDCTPLSTNRCRVTVDKPGGESSLVTFYKQPAVSAAEVQKQLAAVQAAISAAIGGALGGKKPSAPPQQLILPPKLPTLGPGTWGGGFAATFQGLKGTPKPAPTPPASFVTSGGTPLVGSDGATLIGSDGASLIGSDGATLIGSDGASFFPRSRARSGAEPVASTSAKKGKKKKAKPVSHLLGRYAAPTNGTASVTPTMQLTAAGRALIAKIGKINAKRAKRGGKPIAMNMTLVEVFQPEDKMGTGGAYTQFTVK